MKGLGMSSLEEACQLIQNLAKISEPKRNIYPGFNKAHVFLAIKWISHSPRSRLFLEKNLGIGEASVKTLIKRLKEEGLVKTSKHSGSIATAKGVNLSRKLQRHIQIYKASCSPTSKNDLLILIPNISPPKEMVDVYSIRDYLVRSGCNISLIGGYHSSILEAPGVDSNYIEHLRRCIEESSSYKLQNDEGIFIFLPKDLLSVCLDGILSYLLSLC
jgi:predicted transcriptional regulator